MRWSMISALSVLLLTTFSHQVSAQAPDGARITGPITHENLSIYFIHGPSAAGKVPLTLEEALARKLVQVRETGNVNQLEIENLGGDPVFIQSGDIVKGGQQDRTLMVSLVLPPRSGPIAIASFCVEQGRWTARGHEDVQHFSSADASVPSRELKLAMKAPRPVAPGSAGGMSYAAETGARQQEVWASVQQTQKILTDNLGAPVRSNQSASSLQLALENAKLIDVQHAYVRELKPAGEVDDDIVGYIFAVNGKLNSADVYPSNGLFRKMWPKLLSASAIEAIGHKDEPGDAAPTIETVHAFLTNAEHGRESVKPLTAGLRLVTRDGDAALYFETGSQAGFVHRNYLAK